MPRKARPVPVLTLDQLPIFASDREISEAIVGRERAEKWMVERLPTLVTKPGFPPVDAFHGGRPVALVKLFYSNYLHETSGTRAGSETSGRGKEHPEAWKKSRRRD